MEIRFQDCPALYALRSPMVTRAKRLNAYAPEIVKNATYAVTIEQPGGSPNGKPSGAPVFVGKLIPVGP